MLSNENDDITDLIIPEDDLLSFQVPTFEAVRCAYSKSFNNDKLNPIKHIEQLFPKKPNKHQQTKDNEPPAYSIDKDEDPINI
ncbi:MAG: hypothetical protein QM479_04200 [Pseudomonadota bacterium]